MAAYGSFHSRRVPSSCSVTCVSLMATTLRSESTLIGRDVIVLARTGVSASSSIVQPMALSSSCAPLP